VTEKVGGVQALLLFCSFAAVPTTTTPPPTVAARFAVPPPPLVPNPPPHTHKSRPAPPAPASSSPPAESRLTEPPVPVNTLELTTVLASCWCDVHVLCFGWWGNLRAQHNTAVVVNDLQRRLSEAMQAASEASVASVQLP
jgi:hypothetical protein